MSWVDMLENRNWSFWISGFAGWEKASKERKFRCLAERYRADDESGVPVVSSSWWERRSDAELVRSRRQTSRGGVQAKSLTALHDQQMKRANWLHSPHWLHQQFLSDQLFEIGLSLLCNLSRNAQLHQQAHVCVELPFTAREMGKTRGHKKRPGRVTLRQDFSVWLWSLSCSAMLNQQAWWRVLFRSLFCLCKRPLQNRGQNARDHRVDYVEGNVAVLANEPRFAVLAKKILGARVPCRVFTKSRWCSLVPLQRQTWFVSLCSSIREISRLVPIGNLFSLANKPRRKTLHWCEFWARFADCLV